MNKLFENLKTGEYLLKAVITAKSDTKVTLYGNHRHFLIKDEALFKGCKIEREFAIAIRDADFQKQDNYRDSSLSLTLEGDVECEFTITASSFPVIYTIGDSTVCNQTNNEKSPMERCGGWGQALPMFLRNRFAISNHAEQGTHTRNCLDCHIKPVLEQLKKGDIVLCQFGHNDQKQPWLMPFEGYLENLLEIGRKVMEKGAEFKICTPINRLIYIDSKLNDYLDLYRDACFEAAKRLNTTCIDLHSFTSQTYLFLGEKAEDLFYHSPELDRTHPNDYGAMLIASRVSTNIK